VTSVGVSREQEIQSRPGSRMLASPQKQKLVYTVLLILATVALYYPAHDHPFVNFDDNLYVTENAHVTAGLHWQTVKWAFTTFEEGNWHPLTWLSHAADMQFYGLNPSGHHDTNLFLHVLNVVLLFWVLQQATSYVGRSAMVAALFALHPINVETVAWIAERKNLLSMTFFLLALGSYRWYVAGVPQQWVRQPSRRRREAGNIERYLVLTLLFVVGLMCKPQIITLPFVLLLWDHWPLGRVSSGPAVTREFVIPSIRLQSGVEEPAVLSGTALASKNLSWVIIEKLPLFALSAASAIVTVKAQRAGHAFRAYPFSVRLENAVAAYASYVKKAFWPLDLAPMYPHPGDSIPTWHVLVSLLFLLAITLFAFRCSLFANSPFSRKANGEERTANRAIFVGWLWFVGTLAPMIGLVQVGTQAMADRYAYLPMIGLFIMICWGIGEWAQELQISLVWQRTAGIVLLVVLAAIAHRQIGFWENNVTLWSRTLQVTKDNWVAEDNLGGALMEEGKLDAAISHFRAAAAIYPADPVSHLDIGFYEQEHKNWPHAMEQYQEVLKLTPSPKLRAEAYNNLALVESDLGDYGAARDNFQRAVDASPRYVGAWVGLGLAAQKSGDVGAAIRAYSRAAEIQPSDLSYLLLARALDQAGRKEEAQAAGERARQMSSNFLETKRTAERLLAQ
jgi:protein O-mannosyl-transferase